MSLSTAMILAAGRGERLRPLTDKTPKPLIDLGGKKLIEFHLLALAKSGFRRVVINLAHLGEQIEQHIGDGRRYGLEVTYSREPAGALETAGGIANALDLLEAEEFLVINGDIRCTVDFSSIALPPGSDMHLLLVANPAHNPLGDFTLDTNSNPRRLLEIDKTIEPVSTGWTFSGIGTYRASIFRNLAEKRLPLASLISQAITRDRASAEIFNGMWFDIGTPDRLEQARKAETIISY